MSEMYLSEALINSSAYEFMCSQSTTYLPINRKYSNTFTVKTVLASSGSVFSTQVVQQRQGHFTYPNNVLGLNSSMINNICKMRFIFVNNGTSNYKYKFPAGTKLQVYARKLIPFE